MGFAPTRSGCLISADDALAISFSVIATILLICASCCSYFRPKPHPAHGHAQPLEEFYEGRTVSLVVSASPGGGYDSVARVVVRHLGRHLAGNPTIVVDNMPGAGGVRAPNYLYSVAGLLGNAAAIFDPRRFGWLGSPGHETGILMLRGGSPAHTIEDLQKSEITVGVEALASTPAFNARLLINTLGLKLRLVAGYPGSSSALLAMERGEVDAFPNFYSSLMQTRPSWLAEGKTKILVQWGPGKEPALSNVPYLTDLVTDPIRKGSLRPRQRRSRSAGRS